MKKLFMILLVMAMMLSVSACVDNTVDGAEDEVLLKSEKKSTVSQTLPKESQVGTTEQSTVTSKTNETKQEIVPITLGQKVITKNCEFTLNRVELSYDVVPDNPPSYYSHYPASTGQVYIYLNATVKNTQKQSLPCDEIYSVEVDYDSGYKYRGFNIANDYDGDFTYANINSVEPLQSLGVHCLVDCPEEVETSEKPLSLTISFKDGTKYFYKIR